jgi:hypothetical protein
MKRCNTHARTCGWNGQVNTRNDVNTDAITPYFAVFRGITVNAGSKAPASWRSAGCAVMLVVKLVVTLVVKRRPVGVALDVQ